MDELSEIKGTITSIATSIASSGRAYFGIEPSKQPDLSCLVQFLAVKRLIEDGFNMTILLADVHVFLNKGLDETERTHEKVAYYSFLIDKIMYRLGIPRITYLHSNIDLTATNHTKSYLDNKFDHQPTDDLEYIENYHIIQGSTIQLTPAYIAKLLQASTLVNTSDVLYASSDIIKSNDTPKLSTLLYPLMQILDEITLEADVQIGDINQAKIFDLSSKIVEKLGFHKCQYIITPTIANFATKIQFTDTYEIIQEKINNEPLSLDKIDPNYALCIAIAKYLVFDILEELGPYINYETFIKDLTDEKYPIKTFKIDLAHAINQIIAPIRDSIGLNKELFDNAFCI